MITITQPQIETISFATERYLRKLRRNKSQDSTEYKQIEEWLRALKFEKCELSFLRLSNLLDLFKVGKISIAYNDISTAEMRSRLKMIIEELAKRTEHLDRVLCVTRFLLPKESDIIESLKHFKGIGTFSFGFVPVNFEILGLVATLPIQRLRVNPGGVEQDVIRFIRENDTIENLEILPFSAEVLPCSILIEALRLNRRLIVCSLF